MQYLTSPNPFTQSPSPSHLRFSKRSIGTRTKIFNLEEKEIPSSTVGELVMERIERILDEVASGQIRSPFYRGNSRMV